MYCPNCNHEFDGKFCPECGTKLIEKPADSSVNLKLGDANAISGGLHVADSHNVHNEDRSVHNISNTTSNVTNITQVAAQKSEMELLQEKKAIYLTECKRAYEDNVLEQSEVVVLEECRIKLGLDKSTADAILESVRVMSERNARKTALNPIARTKLKILTDNLQKNEVKALMDQIDGLEPLVRMYDHDELARKFFLVLAALKSEKCIELKENSKIDSYWKSFWSYLAYIKSGRITDAENVLISLDRFTNYPEDNMSVLAVAGALMIGNKVEAKEYLDAVTGEYTPALQRFVDSIYLLLEPEVAKEMGADENTCAFYLVNFFGQKDAKAKAEEERLKKEKEETERKRIEAEKKRKAEEEARKKAEEERRQKEAKAERKREEEEEEKKRKAEETARKKAEEERRRKEAERKRLEEEKRQAEETARKKAEEERKEEERQKREKASWMVVCDCCGKSVLNSEPHCPYCASILRSHATAHSMIICKECGNPVDSSNKRCQYCASNLKGHEYVDLGLPSGTLWATCNIGASKPEELGNYFAWGETSGYNEGKREFDDEHYKFRIKKKGLFGSKWIYTKYCDNKKNGEVDNKLSLDKEDDAAYVQWGKGWRIPTTAQFEELINKDYTTLEQLSKSGVKGLLITSKANGNSIFLPEAGHHGYSESMSFGNNHTWEKDCSYSSKRGNYWTRERLTGTYQHLILGSILSGNLEYAGTHFYDDTANSLHFSFKDEDSILEDKEISCYMDKNENGEGIYPDEHRSRCEGYSIRPVLEDKK